jgi:uncharacterized membrane protein YhaH (DUF805 family)
MSLSAKSGNELRRVVDYRGRSTRTDLGAFWLVTVSGALILLVVATILEAEVFPDLPLTRFVPVVYQWILAIPMLALFVRRLHDRGLSGWWAALCVPVAVQNIIADYHQLTGDMEAMLAVRISTSHLIAGLPLLAVFMLLLLPGEDGPNLHGPNPRFQRSGEPA